MVVTIIGAGLAGCEAALQCARRGVRVRLYEMRPVKMTPAHQTGDVAELVCSNSLKSEEPTNAHGLLKAELKILGSVLLECAERARVPGGKALVVDRKIFSREVARELQNLGVELIREEITRIPEGVTIIATGPLTSEGMTQSLINIFGDRRLYFYDAIAPIVAADSLDMQKIFTASRYGKGDDYLNCPLSEEEYDRFVQELAAAEVYPAHEFEQIQFFEGCLPVEELARRDRLALAFGPMKPVGLVDPRTGRMPFAVVQLRPENRAGTMYNLVGFQTRLRRPEQERVFRMIPGLERAEFLRYGSIHRNTFLNSPEILLPTLQTRIRRDLFIAGQLAGVEGYVESIGTGLVAGINAVRLVKEKAPLTVPEMTMLGALLKYITTPNPHFQPMNANFGLLPVGNIRAVTARRRHLMAVRALEALEGIRAEFAQDKI
ncbi:MAG: methylenetetrahydrofolate--tRNA-(uracil(54)-C(5))-methyltransferase (FADH(2)-oxidizing) TrmFO [candidate division WOR-3 bacterium]|uniref:Methylenetetrahydrofolate--tRNA-(uracil-5-)-methyltransferase TrmFO n=1 Tax=candidate division WOR-3 bacterium TaxID=2052148 RepID=A0A7C3F014_UNCW3|nr:methylenetetrahydrofolate--tRNA-(uracil(54)-C(5))-methyltransferase (FADH(2)-oxidizing) TrmFO [candidate division WOR-3 bacterium]